MKHLTLCNKIIVHVYIVNGVGTIMSFARAGKIGLFIFHLLLLNLTKIWLKCSCVLKAKAQTVHRWNSPVHWYPGPSQNFPPVFWRYRNNEVQGIKQFLIGWQDLWNSLRGATLIINRHSASKSQLPLQQQPWKHGLTVQAQLSLFS